MERKVRMETKEDQDRWRWCCHARNWPGLNSRTSCRWNTSIPASVVPCSTAASAVSTSAAYPKSTDTSRFINFDMNLTAMNELIDNNLVWNWRMIDTWTCSTSSRLSALPAWCLIRRRTWWMSWASSSKMSTNARVCCRKIWTIGQLPWTRSGN